MKPQEAIGIMKTALAEVEWEYPNDKDGSRSP